nr:MAG TPA: hypothetical protein [Caudoviricetes sp.]
MLILIRHSFFLQNKNALTKYWQRHLQYVIIFLHSPILCL